MYRLIHPGEQQELPLRMLFHPAGDGVYLEACEADSFRALIAALLDDAGYEAADRQARLVDRLRIANDIALLAQLVRSDEALIRSLEQVGFVSLVSDASQPSNLSS
jgi:hypothetical protein